jgi:hypothetical protein|tara:strand:- start:1022 stop:1258 length:237 start_codon:yes stop_codon:yes gene_type:complete
MKQFEVYGKLISDCSVIVEADTEEEAINVANNIDWDEWDYVEANTLDVDSVREYIVELDKKKRFYTISNKPLKRAAKK